MDNRYKFSSINNNVEKYFFSTIYPYIPESENDIYFVTERDEKIYNLAYRYYKSVKKWYIIAQANGLCKGSFIIPIGTRVRIPDPNNINDFEQKMKELSDERTN